MITRCGSAVGRGYFGRRFVGCGAALVAAAALGLLPVAAWAVPVPEGQVVAYPRMPGDAPNDDFPAVTVNGVPVETCMTAMNVGYAHFAFTGKATVQITAREPVRSFDFSPHRAGIAASAERSVISFELSRPGKFHLQVNGLTRFFLFADPPEDSPPRPGDRGVFELTSLGVHSSPDAVQTAAIQRAIDKAAAAGGVLFVPPGIYRCGELRIKSGLTLYLAAGAILKGTGSLADHPAGELGSQFLHLLDCQNVRLRGRGVIDAQGRALRHSGENSSATRSKLIRSLRARDVAVEDLILRDAGTWAVHLVESTDLRFSNFKLISNSRHDDVEFPWELNTDGFDPDNSSRVLIENGFISCHDDAIAVKLRYGTRRDMEDVQFRGNVVWTVKSALKIGTEVNEKKISNVVFENNDVIRADRGISVYCYAGATIENARWINNHFEFIGGDIKRMHIEIKIENEGGAGHICNVRIADNTFEQESENASRVRGLDAEHAVEGVTIVNLVIAGRKRATAEDARLEVSRHVTGLHFR